MKTKKLNITEGEWYVSGDYRNKVKSNILPHGVLVLNVNPIGAYSETEAENNSILIADTGTTYNKCGLLPSELLKQRDELLKQLKELQQSIAEDEAGADY